MGTQQRKYSLPLATFIICLMLLIAIPVVLSPLVWGRLAYAQDVTEPVDPNDPGESTWQQEPAASPVPTELPPAPEQEQVLPPTVPPLPPAPTTPPPPEPTAPPAPTAIPPQPEGGAEGQPAPTIPPVLSPTTQPEPTAPPLPPPTTPPQPTVLLPTPTALPQPEGQPEPVVEPSATIPPLPTAEGVPPQPTATATPTLLPLPTEIFSATATTEPTAPPPPTATAEPTVTPSPTATYGPSPTPTATATSTPEPVVFPYDLVEMPAPGEQGQMRAFWVDNADPGMFSREQIDILIDNLTYINANTIFAQVRRHGDAMHVSSLEPRFVGLPPAEEFDPLAYLLERAHAAGIKVHAWIVISVVCAGNDQTGHPLHVCTEHGHESSGTAQWITSDYAGNTIGYLDFGHPAAVLHMEQVVEELLINYPQLDGVHYDYIRYGDKTHGYNEVSLARFRAAYNLPDDYRPRPSDEAWSQWRRDAITNLVRRLYIRIKAINPQVEVSAATITWGGDGSFGPDELNSAAVTDTSSQPGRLKLITDLMRHIYIATRSGEIQQIDPPADASVEAVPWLNDGSSGTGDWRDSAAHARVFQDWQAWLQEGILDFAVPMNYFDEHMAENYVWYNNWQVWNREHTGKRAIVTGLGGWLNNSASNISQIQRALLPDENGRASSGVSIFDYNEPLADTTWYRRSLYFDLLRASVFATPAPPPQWPWVVAPTTGHIQGIATIQGKVVPNADIRIVRQQEQRRNLGMFGDGWTTLINDNDWTPDTSASADGWYGVVELEPGHYTVTVRDPHDYSRVVIHSVQVQAGVVTTVE